MILATAHVSGLFCLFLAVAMLVPMAVDLSAGHPDWQAFLVGSAAVGTPSLLLALATQGRMIAFSRRFGFLLVSVLWAVTSLVSAVPLLLAGQGLDLADAVFEGVSGITTTGATVISGLDAWPPGMLLWRSMMQWFGGLGIIAMGALILPMLRIGGMQIYRMESSIQSDSPFARFSEFSWAITGFYLLISLACCLAYGIAGMDWFEAINHAMTTVSTGGFSTRDASMAAYGPTIRLIAVLFMILGALPFVAILRAVVTRDLHDALDPQIPVLMALVLVLTLLAGAGAVLTTGGAIDDVAIDALFNVTSIVTTTGFASADYTLWGPFAMSIVLIATVLGGPAGSTSGGIKTYRLIIAFQSLRVALQELIYPHSVSMIRYGGRQVSPQIMRSVNVFLSAFLALLLGLTAAVAATGVDLVTAFTGTLAMLANVGPGLGEVIGPAGNFSTLPDAAKLTLSVAMLLGRLEIMTVLVVLSPAFWRT